ncbi:MAG: hypothetical protein ACKPGB_07380, partial [Dolichospermum sp.]
SCWLSVVGCQLLVVSCQLSVISCQLSVVSCSLSVVSCWLSVVGCQLLVVSCQLLVVKKEVIDRYASCFLLPAPYSRASLIPSPSMWEDNKLLPVNTLMLKKGKFDVELIKVLGEQQPKGNIAINNIFRHKYGWVDSH